VQLLCFVSSLLKGFYFFASALMVLFCSVARGPYRAPLKQPIAATHKRGPDDKSGTILIQNRHFTRVNADVTLKMLRKRARSSDGCVAYACGLLCFVLFFGWVLLPITHH
jgi:hypothetical protein